MHSDWQRLETLALEEVATTLRGFPAPLREKAQSLPVIVERSPSAAHRRDGIAPDTLGLFVGPEYAFEETCPLPLPPQIILFLDNLWDQAEGQEALFRQEVRTTYMHELGHYLGLDEDDLFERGLE